MLKALIVSLIVSLAGNCFASKLEYPETRPSSSLKMPLEVCYTHDERVKLAAVIVDYEKCKIDLDEKNDLIRRNMLTFDKITTGQAWWQEPSFVWGGMVVSFALGGIFTFLLIQSK